MTSFNLLHKASLRINICNIIDRKYPPIQQPFWNTIDIDKISNDELLNMIDHAYDCVLKSFPMKKKKEIENHRFSFSYLD